jgi:hypothetical protein
MAEAEAKTRVRAWLKGKRMADTKAETELTADDIQRAGWESYSGDEKFFALLAKYTTQQNLAYVKRLCEKARKPHTPAHDGTRAQMHDEGWNACADYIEREGGKDD